MFFFFFFFHTDRQTDRYIKSQDIKVYTIVDSERDKSDLHYILRIIILMELLL